MNEKDSIEPAVVLVGINPEDQLLSVLQIDKEHHAVYATLIEHDKQVLREIVREVIREELQRLMK